MARARRRKVEVRVMCTNYWKFQVDKKLTAVFNMRYPLPMFIRYCLWFLDSLIFDWRFARNRFANFIAGGSEV